DPNAGPLQPVLDLVGSGINYAGNVIRDPENFGQLPGQVIDTIYLASSKAFVDGMHRSFIITGVAIVAVSVLSYFMIKDSVAETAPEGAPDEFEIAPVIPPVSSAPGE